MNTTFKLFEGKRFPKHHERKLPKKRLHF